MSDEMKHQTLGNKGVQHLSEDTLLVVAETFKALSNPTRIRILNLLCTGEHSVNDIAKILNLSQTSVSHQLRILKNIRLAKYRREGTTLYYSEDDAHVMDLMRQAIEHAAHN